MGVCCAQRQSDSGQTAVKHWSNVVVKHWSNAQDAGDSALVAGGDNAGASSYKLFEGCSLEMALPQPKVILSDIKWI